MYVLDRAYTGSCQYLPVGVNQHSSICLTAGLRHGANNSQLDSLLMGISVRFLAFINMPLLLRMSKGSAYHGQSTRVEELAAFS